LAKISKIKPKTKSELLNIKGINERMFNKLGDDFLEILNSYKENKKTPKSRSLPSNILETYNLLQNKYSLQEISKLRKLNEAVISMQIETILEYSPEIDISSIIKKENLEIIKEVYKQGKKGLKEIKESLPKEFSYPLIRIALAKISNQSS